MNSDKRTLDFQTAKAVIAAVIREKVLPIDIIAARKGENALTAGRRMDTRRFILAIPPVVALRDIVLAITQLALVYEMADLEDLTASADYPIVEFHEETSDGIEDACRRALAAHQALLS
jgi:hypothetical protein